MNWLRRVTRSAYPAPMYNITVDDSSPMITYDPAGAWIDNVYGDPTLFKYYQTSYHYTTTLGASATLTFIGTGVTVLGSQSLAHDAFEIRIDNRTVQGLNAYSSTKQYQVALAAVKGMRYGTHTIQVINRSKSSVSTVLDVDAFIIEGTVPQAPNASNSTTNTTNTTMALSMMDDAAPANGTNFITWSGGWATTSNGGSLSDFMNSTVHETTQQGSSVTFNFVGEAIQVLGGVGPNNTQYTVQVDGGQIYSMNANASDFLPSSTLFYSTDLDSGLHQVVLTNSGANGKALTIDAFQFYNSGAPDGTSSNGATKPNVGLIVGVVMGALVFIILLIGGFLYWRQRREESEDARDSDKFSIQAPSYMERIKGFSLTRALSRSSSRASTAVDPEHGSAQRSDENKDAGYGFGSGLWSGLKGMVVRNPDPATPPLPFQNGRPAGGVGDVPGSIHNPHTRNVEFGDTTYAEEPNAARVWVNGSQQIEQNQRFSNQSLDQAWNSRGNTHPYAQSANTRQGHSRNRSSPVERSRSAHPARDRRNSGGAYTLSNYEGGEASPGGTEYPETPARPRYEIDLGSPAPKRQNSDRRPRADFR